MSKGRFNPISKHMIFDSLDLAKCKGEIDFDQEKLTWSSSAELSALTLDCSFQQNRTDPKLMRRIDAGPYLIRRPFSRSARVL